MNMSLKMPHICHICQLGHVQISDNYVSMYATYEHHAINNVTTNTGIHPFTLFSYTPEHIYIPHWTYMSHYKKKTATYIYHAIAIYVQATNMPFKCQCVNPEKRN